MALNKLCIAQSTYDALESMGYLSKINADNLVRVIRRVDPPRVARLGGWPRVTRYPYPCKRALHFSYPHLVLLTKWTGDELMITAYIYIYMNYLQNPLRNIRQVLKVLEN